MGHIQTAVIKQRQMAINPPKFIRFPSLILCNEVRTGNTAASRAHTVAGRYVPSSSGSATPPPEPSTASCPFFADQQSIAEGVRSPAASATEEWGFDGLDRAAESRNHAPPSAQELELELRINPRPVLRHQRLSKRSIRLNVSHRIARYRAAQRTVRRNLPISASGPSHNGRRISRNKPPYPTLRYVLMAAVVHV